MAEFSDRSDCGLPWRNVLHATADILPCAICKTHLQSAIGHISLAQPRPAAVMRELLRHFLWTLHQSSATVGISEESLTGLYGGTRPTVLHSVREEAQVIDETFRRLHILNRHHEGGLRVWVQAIHHLTRLLSVLEPPPLVGRRRR
jgi:hypothetical protein